jgi:hypothetical protein
MSLPVNIMMTMDCESAKVDVSDHGIHMSSSGPADYVESERSIRGFVETIQAAGFPATLFLHPEVAIAHRDLVLDLQTAGACLGLHLHPYKMVDSDYTQDLGAYPESLQRTILQKATDVWAETVGQHPRYFRAGYFSANDSTFGILEDLGYHGGSLSNPGRLLPSHFSVWRSGDPYPHRAHRAFRLVSGDSDFIEVPVAVAYGRPVARGHAGEEGYEWPYIPHTYDHAAVISDILGRFQQDRPRFGTFVSDTHNDHDYTDPSAPASVNLRCILDAIEASCEAMNLVPEGITIDTLCDRVREASP